MTTLILAGTKGNYNPIYPSTFGDTSFEVMEDTCSDSEKITVKFTGATISCWISMSRVQFQAVELDEVKKT